MIHDIDTRFTIPKLKAMCTALGLTVSGAKPQLQGRLTTHLNLLFQRHDSVRYNLAKSSAEVQRGSSYGPRVTYGPSGRQKIDFSRPNGYHTSSTTQASTATPVQTTSTSTNNSNNNNWGMSSLYQNLRLRICPFYTFANKQLSTRDYPSIISSQTSRKPTAYQVSSSLYFPSKVNPPSMSIIPNNPTHPTPPNNRNALQTRPQTTLKPLPSSPLLHPNRPRRLRKLCH